MFDTIILVTGLAEQPALASVLREHNPRLTIRAAASPEDLEAIEPGLFQRARMIGFATSVVVPAGVLDALGFGAYNFHPGPPDYPGRFPAHFAIYNQATTFGATAHVMTLRVDSGPIVGVELFPMPPQPTVDRLEALAFACLARVFWRLAPALATHAEPLTELRMQWSGRKSSLRLHAAMCDIQTDVAKEELDRRVAAFGDGHYGVSPTITLHGHKFRYVQTDGAAEVEAPGIIPAQPPALEPV
jgi:methionyl-tRNA formyltransferase